MSWKSNGSMSNETDRWADRYVDPPQERHIVTNTVENLVTALNKKFGTAKHPAAHRASEMPPVVCHHSGSLALDFALGKGGLPTNRIIEIVGKEGGGKTTLALLAAREWIEAFPERTVLYFDLEHKLTPEWATKLVGEKAMENLIIVEPESVEQMIDIYREFVPTGDVSMAIVDSIGGAPSSRSMDPDRSAEKANVAGNAQAISLFSRFAANLSSKYDCTTIGINQMRDNMTPMSFAINTPGGHAWKHACVARIQLSPGKEKFYEVINGEKIQVGYEIVARVFKNQLASPYRTANWKFFNQESEQYGPVGIDTGEECLRLATLVGVIEKRGAWLYHEAFPDGGKINGDKKFREMLDTDRELRELIIEEVKFALAHDPAAVAQVAPMVELDDEEALKQGLINAKDA